MTETIATSMPGPEDEVVRLCQELIRIDSTNDGTNSGPVEAEAAAWVVERLREVGLDPQTYERVPGRPTVVLRLEGEDRTRPGLCLHGHLDVVPANAADWQVDPFSGELRDGCIWGRGAVDMKDMDAMILAIVRHLARTGTKPPRDLVIAFFADEEAAGTYGAQWLVQAHSELFDGVTEAISEVGGYSVTLPTASGTPTRAYLLQTAEKGLMWVTLRATGRAGHASVPSADNAITHLAQAVTRIAAHPWPGEYIEPVSRLLADLGRITGLDPDSDLDTILGYLGGAGGFVRATLADTAVPTVLAGGYKHNVIPQEATAKLDGRFLPGHEEEFLTTLRELAGEHVEVIIDTQAPAVSAPATGSLIDAMAAAVRAEDPDAEILPYCLSAGTDNKSLSLLGIAGYGFVPLRLPEDLDFGGMFHGIDERVPVDALLFGTRVLARLIATC